MALINLFVLAPNDQSVCYLTHIFGTMEGVLPPSDVQCTITPGTGISLLGKMFQTFNSVVLAVGALLVVYTTVVGVMMTAHEGEFMGKKWNNIWIPIRTVLGIAALVPTSSGYSAIQIVMMWIIIQGIGAADVLWNTVAGYLKLAGSPYAQVSIPPVGIDQTLGTLFQGLVCDESARATYKNPYIKGSEKGGYYCDPTLHPNDAFCGSSTSFNANGTSYQLGKDGACGTLKFCDLNAACSAPPSQPAAQIACISCKTQHQVLQQVVPVLRSAAAAFVQLDYQYQEFYDKSVQPPPMGGESAAKDAPSFVKQYCSANNISPCAGASLPKPSSGMQSASDTLIQNLYWKYGLEKNFNNFLGTSSSEYTTTINKAVNAYLASQGQNSSGSSGSPVDTSIGWIFAGSYYYAISQMSGNNLQAALPPLSMTANDPESSGTNPFNGYRNNYSAASTLVNMPSVSTPPQPSGGGNLGQGPPSGGSSGGGGLSSVIPSKVGGISSAMSSSMVSMQNSFKTSVGKNTSGGSTTQGGSNPLSNMVMAGQILLLTAQILFVAFLGITLLAALFGFFDAYFLGTGVNNSLGGAMITIYMILVPVVLALLGALVSMGGLLAVYVPLIPYIIFTFGAIAWLMSTIEAMVAGPLVALGILSPSGQHELLGKAEPALMLVFYIFLRPSLMIFGLMAAMLMALVVKMMIDAAFWNVVGSIAGPKGIEGGPLESILFLAAYVFLLVAAFNKCFAAIYIIPQRVMAYIGGERAVGEGGEAAALEETKGGVARAGAGAAGGMAMPVGKEEGARAHVKRIKGKPATTSAETTPPKGK